MTIRISLLLALAAVAEAQTVAVTGTGDPSVDVAAVQAAVDQGGQVVLLGRFSFDAPATKPDGASYGRMVTVSQAVAISGNPDANGEMPVIEGGFVPFFVAAPGSRVAIRGLHFVRPKGLAIWVFAAGGLVITDCRIEGVDPSAEYGGYEGDSATLLANGIFVGADPTPLNATHQGTPENFSGTFSIMNNDIDVGGAASDHTLAIVVFGVGKSPDSEVDLYIVGNHTKNCTERVININTIGGRVHIEGNTITIGPISSASSGLTPNGINLLDTVSSVIAHNTIVAEWATGSGILVQGNVSETGAIVVDNDVTMTAAEGTTFATNSAGIMIAGFANGNTVVNNRIRGRARAAVYLTVKGTKIPGRNTFVSNDIGGLTSTQADVLVDAGVTNTVVVGTPGKIEDHGAGTVVVPMR
jgi:hypothetical protein